MEGIKSQIRGADNMLSINQNTTVSDIKKSENSETGNSDANSVKEFKKVSRDGDTLEISSDGEEKSTNIKRKSVNDKLIISESTKKSDAELRSCSQSQLRKLFSEHKITRQQYEKFMKNAIGK